MNEGIPPPDGEAQSPSGIERESETVPETAGPLSGDYELENTEEYDAQPPVPQNPAAPPADPAAAKPDDLPTAIGRYVVLSVLGQGGFGTVYLGYDSRLDRKVAIKVPRFQTRSPEEQQEFMDEARRQAKLNHTGIVTVFDVGFEDDLCYAVSDFVEGPTLSAWLKQHKPSWQQAANWTAALADALTHAHAQRIVHRDLKPGNVILRDGITPVIVDFGLAVSEASVPGDHKGVITGTLVYMSPEQTLGEAHRIDGRTDIYALGVMLYRMLTGRLPFFGQRSLELMRQIREDEPQPLRQLVPELPPDIERICLKAMAKRQDQRYTVAADMADELRRVAAGAFDNEPASPRTMSAGAEPNTATCSEPGSWSQSRRTREAERRQVTVLYCQIDLLDMHEPFDVEDRNDLMRSLLDDCADAVQRCQGAIVPTAGEEVLVCFGYPVAQEDAALRAVRTGKQIVTQLAARGRELQQKRGITLEVRGSIHTGLAVAGEASTGAVDSITLAGEAPQVATRLDAAAEPGWLVVSQAAYQLIQGYFDCEALGDFKVRGMAESVAVYRVGEPSEAHSRIEVAERRGLTPLVGRELEVAMLQRHWADALEEMGQVVLLTGEAGLGKSRLTHVLRDHVQNADPRQTATVVEWRCSSYYQNTGLYAVTEYLERYLEFVRDESADARLDKLEQCCREHHLGRPEEAVPLLASMVSVDFRDRYPPLNLSPAGQKQRTLDLIVSWMLGLSDQQPLLIIVEDLQWADPSTLEVLALLAEQSAGQRILALFTARPEFMVPWGTYAHQSQLALNRLRKSQVGEMMRLQMDCRHVPSEVVDQIVERTSGVPLFVEEYTRMLLETGGVRVEEESLELTASFSLEAIPATLQDLLMARLDRMASLPEVAQLAATLGRDFNYDLIQAVCELDEGELREELGKLVSGEILFQRGRPPQASYHFKHALLRDAAYNSLLKKNRQQLHRRTAEVLINRFAETTATHPELVAHHLTAACQEEAAIPYWLKAGQRSQSRWANREAMLQLERGLDLLAACDIRPGRDQLELDLLLPLGVVRMAVLGYAADEVGECFGRARELCESRNDRVRLFFVLRGLWTWRLLSDELDRCCELCDEVLALVESEDCSKLRAEANFMPGNTYYYRGDFAKSLKYLEAGWELFDREQSQELALKTGLNCGVTTLCQMALALWQLGYPDQAFQRVNQGLELAEELQHPFSRAFALYHRRRIQQYCRLDAEVERSVAEELELAREQGYVFREAQALMGEAACLVLRGRFAKAVQSQQKGEAMYAACGARLSLIHHSSYLAEAYLDAGELDLAREELDKAEALMQHSAERYLEAELLRLRGALWAARSPDRADEVEACFRQALETANRQQAKSRALRIAISWAQYLAAQGQRDQALTVLQPVYEWFTEGQDTPHLLKAKGILDDLLQRD